jgi:hypothetical protein
MIQCLLFSYDNSNYDYYNGYYLNHYIQILVIMRLI